MKKQLVVGMRLVKADVAMRINQAGHNGHSGRIDTLNIIATIRPQGCCLTQGNNRPIEGNWLHSGGFACRGKYEPMLDESCAFRHGNR